MTKRFGGSSVPLGPELLELRMSLPKALTPNCQGKQQASKPSKGPNYPTIKYAGFLYLLHICTCKDVYLFTRSRNSGCVEIPFTGNWGPWCSSMLEAFGLHQNDRIYGAQCKKLYIPQIESGSLIRPAE